MKMTGQHLLAAAIDESDPGGFRATDPATGGILEPTFAEATTEIVAQAVVCAAQSFRAYRRYPNKARADLLDCIAAELEAERIQITARANLETGLPLGRLEAELGRTTDQLRMFARLVVSAEFCRRVIMPAQADRIPQPRPDLRVTQLPLGPVAVFGASNFPLAFSVVGGDTAAALAAGCSVVVKAHPAHPGTSELVGRALLRALDHCQLPAGVFSLVQGSRFEAGTALVEHPLIKAVAFTGSFSGGKALYDLAVRRPEPIPVYAEMGSVNPVFLLPDALRTQGEALATAYADSVSLGVGQFCTNPGLLFAVAGPQLEEFAGHVERVLLAQPAAAMLHQGIKQNYLANLETAAALQGVQRLDTRKTQNSADCFVEPSLLRTTAENFLLSPALAEEIFGPTSLLVSCESVAQMLALAESLSGQLTATVLATEREEDSARQLFEILQDKAGRLILNGFPTGVEVCPAMVHGGPYPATTDSRSTSVGTAACERFLRPICYQNFTPGLLPESLCEEAGVECGSQNDWIR